MEHLKVKVLFFVVITWMMTFSTIIQIIFVIDSSVMLPICSILHLTFWSLHLNRIYSSFSILLRGAAVVPCRMLFPVDHNSLYDESLLAVQLCFRLEDCYHMSRGKEGSNFLPESWTLLEHKQFGEFHFDLG